MQRPKSKHNVRPLIAVEYQNLDEKTLEDQAEVEAESHEEEATVAELKNKVLMSYRLHEEQQRQADTETEDVSEAQQVCCGNRGDECRKTPQRDEFK